jgi:hypothetical protein
VLLRDDAITSALPDGDDEDEYEGQIEFCMPGQHVADRLDVLGIDDATVLEALAETVAYRRMWADNIASESYPDELRKHYAQERDYLDRLVPQDWIAKVRGEAVNHDGDGRLAPVGSLGWLLSLLDGLDYRFALRLGLLTPKWDHNPPAEPVVR